VTNMGDTVEDLAYLDGCIFRLMAWNEIHSTRVFHTLALCWKPTAWMTQNLAGPARRSPGAVVRRGAKRSRMLAELTDTD
jgi:hypothetical protein